MSKVAFITGASRGIGKACAHKFAREGWDVVIAAKTTEPHPKLPGTIFTAAEEIEQHGTTVFPIRCDVTDLESVRDSAKATLDKFGRVDAVINNAGALWWKPMDETPMKRFDLMMNINARGAFAVTAEFLPAMKEQKSGHVIMMSPPIDMKVLPNRIGYYISKFGLTMMAHGSSVATRPASVMAFSGTMKLTGSSLVIASRVSLTRRCPSVATVRPCSG